MDHRISKLVEHVSSGDSAFAGSFDEWKRDLQGNFDFAGVEFPEINLKGANFTQFDLSGAKFIRTQLAGAEFVRVKLNDARFVEVEAPRIQFSKAKLRDATFDGGNLSNAIFHNAELQGAKFLGPDLSGANFSMADISSAIISPSKVDSRTLFNNMRGVEGCKIDRYTLESLDDFGGLTKGDRMRMSIRDDLAKLRSAYSGFQQWLHLIALIVFGFPYVWFLIKSWVVARFIESGQNRITIWEAFFRYIVNGGEGWREGWSLNIYSFSLFVFALVYNVLRLVLLVKTKRLELQESISGLPVPFSLQGPWGRAYNVARVGFWVNLVIVLLHTIYFLQMTIPIG